MDGRTVRPPEWAAVAGSPRPASQGLRKVLCKRAAVKPQPLARCRLYGGVRHIFWKLSRFRNRNYPPRGFLPCAISAESWRHHKKASILPSPGEPAREAEPAPSRRCAARCADRFACRLRRKKPFSVGVFSAEAWRAIRKPAFSPLSANRQRRRNQHRAAAVRRVALTNSLVGFIEKSRFQSVHSPRKPYP